MASVHFTVLTITCFLVIQSSLASTVDCDSALDHPASVPMAEPKNYPNLLRFDLSVEQIKELTDQTIEKSTKLLDEVAAKAQSTFVLGSTKFADTPLQLLSDEDAFYSLNSANIYFPSQVSSDAGIRAASVDANTKLEKYGIEKEMREDVYKAVKSYIDQIEAAAKKLNPARTYENVLDKEEAYFTKKIIQNFERNGFKLPAEKREKLKTLRQDLSELCIKFQQNLNEDVTSHSFTKEELEGMPDSFMEDLKKDDTGKFIVTLKYPDYFPLMKECKVESTRKTMSQLKESQCLPVNGPIFEKVIKLRQEEADLLGYANHAAFTLEPRMAKDAATVTQFLDRLSDKLEAGLKADLKVLLDLKKEEKLAANQPFDGVLHFWDWRYYNTLVLKRDYSIDHERIAEYFPMQTVTEGLLAIYQEILSLRFKEAAPEKTHVWHADVKQYEVYDKTTDKFIGHFYLDLYPRDGKYGHAAEFGLQKAGMLKGSSWQTPAAACVANFPKPSAEKPSLLRHDDVVTYFHEFGHVMHELMSKARFTPLGGTNVQRDFVEAPSQMLENWCFEKECMLRLSKHFKTGEPLPDADIQRLIKAKNAQIALMLRRQIFFAKFDMTAHTLPKDQLATFNSQALWHKLSKEILGINAPENTNGVANFGHLTGGYSAGYYSYLWSEVFSADMYKYFKKNGKTLFDEAIGRRYRDLVLAPGGSCDAGELLVNFLGRAPTEDAFLEHIGLVPETH